MSGNCERRVSDRAVHNYRTFIAPFCICSLSFRSLRSSRSPESGRRATLLRHVDTRHKHKVFGACGRACRRFPPSLLVFFCLLVHMHKKIFIFCLFCLLISFLFRVIIRYQKRMVLIMENTKSKPLLQCSAKYISGICYDSEGLANFVKDNNNVVDEYAYILHDRDVTEDGTPKEPHYHFLFVLRRSRRLADIQSCMKKTLQGNVMLQSCHSVSGAYGYLTHENEDSKVHYDESSVVSSADSSFWKADISSTDGGKSCDTIMSAYLDLLNSMPLTECAKKYGRDFIIHYNHIKSLLIDSGMILDKGVYLQRGDFVNYNDDFMYRYKNGSYENVPRETNTDLESE